MILYRLYLLFIIIFLVGKMYVVIVWLAKCCLVGLIGVFKKHYKISVKKIIKIIKI